MSTFVSEVQLWNAYVSILLVLVLKFTVVSCEQPLNAYDPMLVSVEAFAMLTVPRCEHPENACFPILEVLEDAKSTAVRAVQFRNALSFTAV